MLPKNRPPTSPGEMLREEFIVPLGLTQKDFADKLGVSLQTVNLILKEKRAITAEMAVRLSQVLGTSAEFWMGLQTDWELWHTLRRMESKGLRLKRIGPKRAPPRAPQRRASAG